MKIVPQFVRPPALPLLLCALVSAFVARAEVPSADAQPGRTYSNTLRVIENPPPLLADYPEFFEPIVEERHYEAPVLVNDEGANLDVRAWRFSYNARGIIEMPNRLRAVNTKGGERRSRRGWRTSARQPRTTLPDGIRAR